MKKNKIKSILKAGRIASNGWLHIPNTWTAEVMAHAGWDSVTIDMQHGLPDIETATQMMQAISTTDTVPLARVDWNDPPAIMRLLDAGAYGIICPMINQAADCKNFVKACKYPPLGYRSFGPIRARLYAGADYGDHANEEILTIAMIETEEAVNNIDAINAVDGLDAIFVGSSDLQLSLTGRIKYGANSYDFDKAIDKVLQSCCKYDVTPGIWCSSAKIAKEMIEKGFRFFAVMSDSMILNEYARRLVEEVKI